MTDTMANDFSDQHWHILGAGSIGCLLASYLTRAHQATTLCVKDEIAQNVWMQEKYLHCKGDNETQAFVPRIVIAPQMSEPIHRLIVTVKAYDVIAALESVAHAVRPNTVILLLQNGLGIMDAVRTRFPHCTLIRGLTTLASRRLSRTQIREVGHGELVIGSLTSAPLSIAAQQAIADLDRSAIPVHWDPQITSRLWEKLVVNCSINPLTAVLRCRNGVLLHSAYARLWIQQLCAEIETLIQAMDLPGLPGSLTERVYDMADRTAKNRSSMLCDVLRGDQTEIDFLNGYVVRQAEGFHLAMPYNHAIWRWIHNLSLSPAV